MGTRARAHIDDVQIEEVQICVVLCEYDEYVKAWWDVKWNSLLWAADGMMHLLGFEVTKSNLMRKLDLLAQIGPKEFHSGSKGRISFNVILHLVAFMYSTYMYRIQLHALVNTFRFADTSLNITWSWSWGGITSTLRLWGMETLSALEEWHIEHKEVWEIQGLGVIKQHCGSHHCPLHNHCRHKSLAFGVWGRCHLEKCNVKTMSFQRFLQNFLSTYTREYRLEQM